MEQPGEWSARVAARVGSRVAQYRSRDGKLSTQALAERCAALGHPLDRSVIAKLEKGHRRTVTVAEVLVLSKALGVPPLLLVLPVGQAETVEILPGREADTWAAAKWFTAEAPYFDRAGGGFDEDVSAPLLYRTLDRQLALRRTARDVATRARREAAAVDGHDVAALLQQAQENERLIDDYDGVIRALRRDMQTLGVRPPPLPPELAHLDEVEPGGDA